MHASNEQVTVGVIPIPGRNQYPARVCYCYHIKRLIIKESTYSRASASAIIILSFCGNYTCIPLITASRYSVIKPKRFYYHSEAVIILFLWIISFVYASRYYSIVYNIKYQIISKYNYHRFDSDRLRRLAIHTMVYLFYFIPILQWVYLQLNALLSSLYYTDMIIVTP